MMFDKVLVANRGEIAIRVMRTCRELGISTVAVYSEADKGSLFMRYADEAYCIGEGPASKSYLRGDVILDVAEQSGVEAIHPGYGFLSENPVFAGECERRGIRFIGPNCRAIEKMGDKIVARQIMEDAGVPVLPSLDSGNVSEATRFARDIGFPVIVKASAGGGGIGMQVVWNEDELPTAIRSTSSVAESAFGDPSVFVEKYLDRPRHIEFQVLADSHGNTVHLFERECSIQRRHQKLVEEAPSSVLTPEQRRRMGEAAVRAAEAVDYENAGTVEFLYSDGEFYFLEMNTRLQVEHPITELITGADICKEQIRIAAGEPLLFEQEDLGIHGHAIECRINAEDPFNNFMPTPGRIVKYRSPGGPGIRVDSGVHMGYTIPSYYDSMISKLCAWGQNREEAIERMRRALFEYVITGLTTNIPFHHAVMLDQAFVEGDYDTHFVEERNILDKVKELIEVDHAHILSLARAIEIEPEDFEDENEIVPKRKGGTKEMEDNNQAAGPSDEIVAVITAVLSHYMDTEQFKVRSITPAKQQTGNMWGFVGRLELMNEGLR